MSLEELVKQANYNLKIIMSNKYIVCIIFSILAPFMVNFANDSIIKILFELYISIIGIVIFTDIMQVEQRYSTIELLYLTNVNKFFLVTLRTLINIAFICVFSIVTYFSANYIIHKEVILRIQDYFSVMVVFLPTTMFLGFLSMLIANIFNNATLGYITSFIYWLIWFVNRDVHTIFNLFCFSSQIEYYIRSKVFLAIFSLIILSLNYIFINRSPFSNIILLHISKIWIRFLNFIHANRS